MILELTLRLGRSSAVPGALLENAAWGSDRDAPSLMEHTRTQECLVARVQVLLSDSHALSVFIRPAFILF